MKISPFLFLLGGHDLEMIEIALLLSATGQEYLDRKLAWGAELSAYQEDLIDPKHKGKIFVAIELLEDIALPAQYIRIDHHNDLKDMAAAIVQVTELLGLQPTRWQQLVAANDSGFIKGMVAIGATPEEIAAVRTADRKAQGVTEEDERLAQESIAHHSRVESGVTIIKSLPILFTPITDRMYGKSDRLLCYRTHKLTYYGVGVAYLGQHFADLMEQGIAYQGGGEDGYFGLAEGKAPGKIEDWIARILEVLEDV